MSKKKKKSKKQQGKSNKVLHFEKLSWKQIDEMDRDKTIFFLPISPLEEHGPHLPVGTDFLTAEDTASRAIKTLNKKKPGLNYILLPGVPIGYCDFNTEFPGSFSVDSSTIKKIVYSFGKSLAEHDFRYLIICTYHMALLHLKGIYSAMKKLRNKYNMAIYEPWGPYFYNNMVEKREPKLGFDTSKEVHAGFRETSLMKYQYPYLVDKSYKELQSIYRDLSSPRTLGKSFKELGLKNGYVGSPGRADADYGRWFFSETVNVYVNSAISLYKGEKLPDLPKDAKKKMKLIFWK